MDYRYLEAFIECAKQKNLTRAAEILNVTTAAISRQIKLLEESVGKQLIIRSPKNFLLTQEGEELFREAAGFHRWIQDSFLENNQIEIRIMALQGVIDHYLMDKLKIETLPENISINLMRGEPGDTKELLETGKIEFAITNKQFQNETLSSVKLFQEEIVLVSSFPIQNISLISTFPWLIPNKTDYLVNFAQKNNMESSEKISLIQSTSAIIKQIKNSNSIAMLPKHLLKDVEGIHIIDIPFFDQEFIYLTMLNFKQMPAAQKVIYKRLVLQ
jgi:DNA-binding transcriptional LysR family regulator